MKLKDLLRLFLFWDTQLQKVFTQTQLGVDESRAFIVLGFNAMVITGGPIVCVFTIFLQLFLGEIG